MTEHPCRRTLRAPPGRAHGAISLCDGAAGFGEAPREAPTASPRGEAQAAFEAFWTAGFTIADKAPVTPPAFADVHYIMLNINHEDVHCCTLDWFAYGIGLGWGGTNQEAAADRDAVQVNLQIDGLTVDYGITAAKRVIAFGDVWGWTYGALVAPGSLSIGAHTLTTTVVDPLLPGDSLAVAR